MKQLRITDNAAAPAVLQLRLWHDADTKPFAVLARPLSRTSHTLMGLPLLPRGDYEWSLSAGANTVAVGNFRTPCDRRDMESLIRRRLTKVDACSYFDLTHGGRVAAWNLQPSDAEDF